MACGWARGGQRLILETKPSHLFTSYLQMACSWARHPSAMLSPFYNVVKLIRLSDPVHLGPRYLIKLFRRSKVWFTLIGLCWDCAGTVLFCSVDMDQTEEDAIVACGLYLICVNNVGMFCSHCQFVDKNLREGSPLVGRSRSNSYGNDLFEIVGSTTQSYQCESTLSDSGESQRRSAVSLLQTVDQTLGVAIFHGLTGSGQDVVSARALTTICREGGFPPTLPLIAATDAVVGSAAGIPKALNSDKVDRKQFSEARVYRSS
uniref:Uncharacterized protein n=1 Tax=Timema cristinae TaxID=61476 RepID=A0A7R9D7H3_TIMCR|nr:unnamed protein product [Timema cristinae]